MDIKSNEMPDIRAWAAKNENSPLPEVFSCDSAECRREQNKVLHLSGVKNENKLDKYIQSRVNYVNSIRNKMIACKQKLKREEELMQDILTEMGFDSVSWGQGNLYAIKECLHTWKPSKKK